MKGTIDLKETRIPNNFFLRKEGGGGPGEYLDLQGVGLSGSTTHRLGCVSSEVKVH